MNLQANYHEYQHLMRLKTDHLLAIVNRDNPEVQALAELLETALVTYPDEIAELKIALDKAEERVAKLETQLNDPLHSNEAA